MANQTGTCTVVTDPKFVIERDRYDCYQVTGTTADAIKGWIYVRKDVAFSASDTCTFTKA